MENFEVISEAPSQYRYFDRLYRAELVFIAFFGPALAALWSAVALYYYRHGNTVEMQMLLRPAIYLTIMFLAMRVLYRSFRAAAATKSIVIDGDRISKRSRGNVYTFDRADIARVRLSKLPVFRRHIILEASSSKESLRLPFYVRNGHKMVDRIFRGLEAAGRGFDGAAALREGLYNEAQRYNILQKLRGRQVPYLLRAAAYVALFSAAIAFIYWERGMVIALCLGITNMLLQAQAYLAAETFHVDKLLKTGGRPDSDTSFTGYYVMAGVAALLAGMVVGILITLPALEYDFF